MKHDLVFETLMSHQVEFIVVGGLAAVVNGAPVTTFDVDIVPKLDDENIDRLLRALDELNAVFRSRPDLSPKRSHRISRGHKLLKTDAGELDVLGAIGNDEDYEALLPDSEIFEFEGYEIHFLGLPGLIRTKKAAGRPKDLLAIPMLEATMTYRDDHD